MLVNNTLEVNLDTEIRKLQPAHIYKLSSLLNMSSGWKRLMSVVPKENSEQYKFGVNQVDLIEQASQQQKRGCAEIFLYEWGTMGKRRPNLRNLLELLNKAELYIAADYVSINILKMGIPERPNAGPAAPIAFPSLDLESESDMAEDASILGDDVEGESFANEGVNPLVPEENRKLIAPIPAFLENMSYSISSGTIIHERSSEMVDISSRASTNCDISQNFNLPKDTENGGAYKIPIFLENSSFYSSSNEIPEESNIEACQDFDIKITLPRLLNDINFSSTASQEDIDVKNEPSSSRSEESFSNKRENNTQRRQECENAFQFPACLDDISLSNISEVSESEETLDEASTSNRFNFELVKESNPEFPHEEIVIKLPANLCRNTSTSESQNVNSPIRAESS